MKAKKSSKGTKAKTVKARAAKKPARAKAKPAAQRAKAAPARQGPVRTSSASADKYSQTGAPWWKAHL